MTHVVQHFGQRLTVACSAALLLSSAACHNTNDLADRTKAVARAVISLHAAPQSGDTVRLSVVLDQSAASVRQVVGSITGAITIPAQWRFVECTTTQGHPLLACHDDGAAVRLGAAWVEGATGGDLITLIFARVTTSTATTSGSTPSGSSATNITSTNATDWQLSLQEVHTVGGQSLLADLDVRAAVVK